MSRQQRELEWLTSKLPPEVRHRTSESLRKTLRFRAQAKLPPLAPSLHAGEWCRFGLLGEEAKALPLAEQRARLRAVLCEMVRTLEGCQPWLVRNWQLAMHAVRLGQLAWALKERGAQVMNELNNGLALLWG